MSGKWDAEMRRVMRGLMELSRVRSSLAPEVAKAIKKEIAGAIKREEDPTGKPFAPHADSTERRWGAHPILRLTGKSLRALSVTPSRGAGVSVDIPSKGYRFAQTGTRFEPRRRILPVDRLPARWAKAIETAARKRIGRSLAK